MPPEPISGFCAYPNPFSSVLTPVVQDRLPKPGTISASILDHTTNIGPFFQTVSQDLCDDGRMGPESFRSGLSFTARGVASGAVVGATGLGMFLGGIFGGPGGAALALGAGAVGLATLPPLAEKAAFGVANFAKDLFEGLRNWWQN